MGLFFFVSHLPGQNLSPLYGILFLLFTRGSHYLDGAARGVQISTLSVKCEGLILHTCFLSPDSQ